MDERTLAIFERSLERCNEQSGFLDLFYRLFFESSPKVKEKFADTDFALQKAALRASFDLMRLVAEDEKAAEKYLKGLAHRHSAADLDIGAELYDLWLDSLIAAVKSCDPGFDSEIEEAWERVMGVGIRYLLSHYRGGAAPNGTVPGSPP